jgi:dUTP pyrophosphatase
MSNAVVASVAASIQIASLDPVTAKAEISTDLISQIPESPLKIKRNVCEIALFVIEDLWPQIQKARAISLSFAQQYGSAWTALQNQYSELLVQKLTSNAVVPSKAHPLDSGFDVTIVRTVNSEFGPGVVLYGTGLVIRPPDGHYVDLVARSSLCKLGWGFANSVGIIDAQYRGELCLPLYKLSQNAAELMLPMKVGQLIVRRLAITDCREVELISQTSRGTGGFGSSGK